MDPDLTPDQEAEAERIYEILKQSTETDLRGLARLLAGKADGEIFGATEFEARDRAHRIAAKAVETALAGRKKGATTGRPAAARTAGSRPSSSAGRGSRS